MLLTAISLIETTLNSHYLKHTKQLWRNYNLRGDTLQCSAQSNKTNNKKSRKHRQQGPSLYHGSLDH